MNSAILFAVVFLSTGSEGALDRRLSELEKLLGLMDSEYDTLADKRETSLRNSGTQCGTLTSYERKGRTPDLAPCPAGLRDDGRSCWNDADIYGKGCCCTLWGCCNKCPAGYHDDGCTCRKYDVGIKVTIEQRYQCGPGEELLEGKCYPKCKDGYNANGCCQCKPIC